MPFEMTVGLLVTDQERYVQYRAEMTPLLEAAGGRFRYDFDVARTLKSEASHDINRVFVIQFPDQASRDRFFADPRYLDIRARLFDTSVAGMTRIAVYAR
jgi:uncharacterized protein (DUF1330 family)